MKTFQTVRGKLSGQILLWVLLAMSTTVYGQQSPITISGTITESGSGIPVICLQIFTDDWTPYPNTERDNNSNTPADPSI